MKNTAFIRENFNFLMFGLMMAAFSSAGQTYYIGIFRTDIMTNYGLSDSAFGAWYLGITLVSAWGLNRFGSKVDEAPLARWTIGLFILMTVGCFLIFLIPAFGAVVIGLMIVRLTGQGLIFHTSMTTMNRYFDKRRGMALSIAVLGIPIGQSFFPPLAAYLKDTWGWQQSWGFIALLYIAVFMPLTLWCLKGFDARHAVWKANMAKQAAEPDGIKSSTRSEVIRDFRFYLIMPAVLLAPFWGTAAFFFVEEITDFKGWQLADFTQLYWLNAVGAVITPFAAGAMVDRFGGVASQLVYPPVVLLAFYWITQGTTLTDAAIFLFLIGVVIGLIAPINNAIWAELYGTEHLGAVKSLTSSIAVVSTALAPFGLGVLLDNGLNINQLMVGAIYHSIAAFVLVLLLQYIDRRSAKKTP